MISAMANKPLYKHKLQINDAEHTDKNESIQVFRFMVRYYGDAGEKADAASVAYFGGRQVLHLVILCIFHPCFPDMHHTWDSSHDRDVKKSVSTSPDINIFCENLPTGVTLCYLQQSLQDQV